MALTHRGAAELMRTSAPLTTFEVSIQVVSVKRNYVPIPRQKLYDEFVT